jgi:N-methylhydantoinase A/oxoprolinase/acetone carboxylase beta subunit
VTFRDVGTVDAPVFLRAALPIGWSGTGPMVIEEADSATLVHQGWRAEVTDGFNLVLTDVGAARHA